MNCADQKFGHNFPYPGAPCIDCGILQSELSYEKPKNIIYEIKKPIKNIHTENHLLAKEICDFYEEMKFGVWLGMIKRKGRQVVYEAFAEAKQNNKPVKWLMWRLSNKYGRN